MSDIHIKALAARVQKLEDVQAIHNHLTRYGLSVDSDTVEATMQLYSEDTVIDIDNAIFMYGREQTRGIVESPAHQAILPTCAHIMGPYVIEVDGDTASATGYATVYTKQEDGKQGIWRQSFGRFDFERRDGRWQITRRTSRSLGHAEAFDLFRRAL